MNPRPASAWHWPGAGCTVVKTTRVTKSAANRDRGPVVGLAPGRGHCRRLRADGRVGAPIVHRLLGRGESLLEVDLMDLAGVFAEPVVECVLRGGEPAEH